jgi:hypothetical protein
MRGRTGAHALGLAGRAWVNVQWACRASGTARPRSAWCGRGMSPAGRCPGGSCLARLGAPANGADYWTVMLSIVMPPEPVTPFSKK